MWIELTSKNGESVYIDPASVDVVEGLPSEGAYVIGEAREPGGSRIMLKSGNSLIVKDEPADIVLVIENAAELEG